MAKVLISIRVFPSDIDVDLEMLKDKIKSSLPEYASVYGFREEPIAFGLNALIAHIVLPEDKAGGIEEVESSLEGIEEISQFETQGITRI